MTRRDPPPNPWRYGPPFVQCAAVADSYGEDGVLVEADGCCTETARNIAAAIRARKGRT